MSTRESNRSKIQYWIQVVTGIAVFLGLGLVVVELRQSQTLAEAQLVSDAYSDYFAFVRQQMGDDPTPIQTKGCLKPLDLTESEMTVVMTMVDHRYDSILRMKALDNIGDFGINWERVAANNLRYILGTPLGLAEFQRFKNNPSRWDPEVVAIAESMLAGDEVFDCRLFFEQWKDGLEDIAVESRLR